MKNQNKRDVINPEWFIGLSTGRFSQSTIEKRAVRIITCPPRNFNSSAMRSGTAAAAALKQEAGRTKPDTTRHVREEEQKKKGRIHL